MKPVCIPCHRFFRCIQTGFYFTEGMPIANGTPPGTEAADQWQPYKVWSGDKFKCEGCGAEIISGFGREPIAVHHEKEFTSMALSLGANHYQVNDC